VPPPRNSSCRRRKLVFRGRSRFGGGFVDRRGDEDFRGGSEFERTAR